MKRLFCSLSLLACLGLASAPALAGDNPFDPKLPFKTAVIKYKMAGMSKGTSTLYIDGQRQAKEEDSTLAMMGMNQKKKSVHITLPDKVIEVDLLERTAKATSNPKTLMAQEYEKLSAAEKANVKKNAPKMGDMMAQQFMGKKPQMSEGSFLGKPVQIATMGTLVSQTWKDVGIVLKTKGAMMGMNIDEEATSIETDVAIKSSVFEVPAGITVQFDQEGDKMVRAVAQMTIGMLKDPDFEKNVQKEGRGGMPMMPMQGMDDDEDDAPPPQPQPRRGKK